MGLREFLDTEDIPLTMRQLNHYVTPPHFALDDVTRFDYWRTAQVAKGDALAEIAVINAGCAIRDGDLGLAEIHLAAARLIAGTRDG